MPDLTHTLFSMVITSRIQQVLANPPSDYRHQRETDMAGADSSLDLDDALSDPKAVQENFVPGRQKQRSLGSDDVVFVLQTKIDLRVAVTQYVNRQQRRVLRDVNEPFSEASDFAEEVFHAVGGMLFHNASRK